MASDRAQYAVAYLQRLGWSPVQAAAIVGHLQQESGRNLSTTIRGDGGHSVGIAQWHRERGRNLKNWASRQGLDWTDLDTQLQFLDHELKTTERAAGARLRASTDIYSAAAAFGGFERPQGYSASNPERMHGWRNRLSNAQALAGMRIDPGAFPVAGGQAGPDQNTVRLAQEALRAQGFEVPLSGSLDSATQAGLQAFRASPGGMAFAQRYGLPVQPQAQAAAYAPAQQQAPAVQAVNAMAQGGQPPRFRVAQVNAQGQTVNPTNVTAAPGVDLVRPGSEYLDARPDRSQPGSYRMDAQPYRGPAPGANPADMLQPAAGNGIRRVQIARLDAEGNPVQPPAPRPPVQMQIGPGAQATLPSLTPPSDMSGRFSDAFDQDPLQARFDDAHGPMDRGRFDAAAPIVMDPIVIPRSTRAPLPSLAEYADPNGALMIGAHTPPVNPLQQYMQAQQEQYRQNDIAAGIPVMSPLEQPPIPTVDVTEGQLPMPRPHPIPMAQRGRSGRTPDGFQWQHVPQKGGPTMLAVTTPQGRKWRTPLGPPGGAGLLNEYMSSFVPIIRG